MYLGLPRYIDSQTKVSFVEATYIIMHIFNKLILVNQPFFGREK